METPRRPRTVARIVPCDWLTVLHTPGWAEGIVSLKLLIPTGSLRDVDYRPGTAHLTGDMLIHGTASRTSEAVAEEIEARGARLSFSVGRDLFQATMQCLTPDADDLFTLLLDLLVRPAFPEDKLVRERETAEMEILEDDDHPLTAAIKLFERTLYGEHPYANDPIGTLEDLPAIDRNAVSRFHSEELRPLPVVVGVAGYRDPDRLAETLYRQLDGVTHRAPAPVAGYQAPRVREVDQTRSIDREWIVLGCHAPSVRHADAVALRVLNAILGGSMDCRLFNEVREKRGLAYQVSSSYVPRCGPGEFFVCLGTDPKNHDEALSCVQEELARTTVEPVSEEERLRAVRYLQGASVMSMESQLGLLGAYTYYETVGLGASYADTLPDLLEQTTVADVQRVAAAYLHDTTLCVLHPDPSAH